MTHGLLRWPHPALSCPAKPVDAVTGETRAIWDRMIAVMEAMPGVGLAAPQLGIDQSLAVVDASEERGRAIRLANPRIVSASAETSDYPESSPNLPGVHAVVTRPKAVRVAYLDETGAERERDFDGLWATSVQHQIDHLAGKLYVDRLSRTKRQMLLRKSTKHG